MSLAQIQYPPPTNSGLQEWAHANWQHHQGILIGLKQVLNLDATMLRIWPWSGKWDADWLQQHQEMHNVMTSALGVPSVDLSDVDYKNRRQLDAWFFSHFIEHQAVASRLALSYL